MAAGQSTDEDFRSPLHFAASLTVEFLTTAIADGAINEGATILDVGCGDGLVAAALIARGFKVTAIDSNFDAVEKARKNGVNVIHQKLSEFAAKCEDRFDVVLLSRALHHMPPAAEALKDAARLLNPYGKVMIDDFAYEKATPYVGHWLFKQAAPFRTSGGHENGHGKHEWLRQKPDNAEAALQIFLQFYQSKSTILNGEQMQEAVAQSGDLFEAGPVHGKPYLFRYICDFLAATTEGANTAAEIWAEEAALLTANLLPAIGFRQILTRKN